MMRRGASFDISFFTDTVIPLKSTPSSSALIPMVVLMQVARAVATRSVGENASPLPLLSVGASVAIFAFDGPCYRVAMQIAGVPNGNVDHSELCGAYSMFVMSSGVETSLLS